jgi:hypothetical protein
VAIHVESSSQTISWFKDRLAEEKLVFKPPFQRNPVWLAKHKAYLIDTAIRGLPIPEVYIQKETDEEGDTIYSIVDGQQRIRTLLEFAQGNVELMETYSPSRDGQAWDDLTTEERKAFWKYRLLTREIENASDADLRDLFRRLNQHTITLNSQELRNARFKGDFIATVTELADESFWAESRIVSANEIRRMLDIEFMAELLVGIMHGPQNKKTTLDGMFETYESGIPEKQQWLKRFEDARSLTEDLVPNLRDTRWRGKSDYYSLFIAVDALLQRGAFKRSRLAAAQRTLKLFGERVTSRLTKEGAAKSAPRSVKKYAVAVEKAASDKDRREARHKMLLEQMLPFFGKS